MALTRNLAWAILGTGGIARKLATAIAQSDTNHLAAVGSRTLARAQAFAREFKAGRAYGSYEEVALSPEVEVVYVALPNHLHAQWTMRCAALGKHVLCEKPLAVNRVEAERVIEAVRSARVFLMEAFMYRCHPQIARLVEIVRRGDIGEVRLIQSGFTYNLGPDAADNVRLSNPMAGGGIMDVGCYPMSLARLVAGAAGGNPFLNPTEIRAAAHLGERSRVDEMSSASVKFPGGTLAALTCGMQGNTEHVARIWGSDGHIVVPSPWFGPERNARLLVQRRGENTPTEILIDAPAPLYGLEVDAVARGIRGGDLEARSPSMSWADTLGNMAALDAWRAEVGLTFDCERR